MIVARAWAGKRYGVFGLARSGAATVDALLASGAEVVAWDEDERRRAQFLPGTGRGTAEGGGGGGEPGAGSVSVARVASPLHHSPAASGPPPRPGEEPQVADLNSYDLATLDALVVSPGVPLNTHPLAARAREAGCPLIGDVELFAQARPELPPHKVVGITGTNGKSTTTALVHHILRGAGVPTTMGGNIGLPILAQEPLPAGGVYVLELSSYQIDLTRSLACDVAVLLNITPDHLDRYDGFEAYAASKRRLFAMQGPDGIAIDATGGAHGEAGDAIELDPEALAGRQAGWPALQGPHNLANAAAAVATTTALGVAPAAIEAGLRSFPGLPHRMERVATRNGVDFVNDSKATNAESAAPALAAYPAVHWILGGQAKSPDLSPCEPHLGHVRAAYAIGDAAPLFVDLLGRKLPATDCGTLDRAVAQAAAAARAGETVLLSPACASFDQFRDFEDRGDRFRALVEAL